RTERRRRAYSTRSARPLCSASPAVHSSPFLPCVLCVLCGEFFFFFFVFPLSPAVGSCLFSASPAVTPSIPVRDAQSRSLAREERALSEGDRGARRIADDVEVTVEIRVAHARTRDREGEPGRDRERAFVHAADHDAKACGS